MLASLYKLLYKFLPKQHIPRLPRGMLSADFETFDKNERRVLARFGARDPRGIKVAMRKHRVASIDELVEQLPHHRAQREFQRRFNALICRMQNATNYDPHRLDLLKAARMERESRKPENMEMKRRLKQVIGALEGG
jgi:uncharacterized membrane-anchored protein YjiN (DUF445 family)